MSGVKSVQYHSMEVAASPDTVHTGPCDFYGVIIETDKTADVVFTVSDASTQVITFLVPGTDDSGQLLLPYPIKLTTSMIITLTGNASRCVVLWGT